MSEHPEAEPGSTTWVEVTPEMRARVDAARRRLGLSGNQLAQAAQVSQPTINRLLNGKHARATVGTLRALEQVLQLDLLGYAGGPPHPAEEYYRLLFARGWAIGRVRDDEDGGWRQYRIVAPSLRLARGDCVVWVWEQPPMPRALWQREASVRPWLWLRGEPVDVVKQAEGIAQRAAALGAGVLDGAALPVLRWSRGRAELADERRMLPKWLLPEGGNPGWHLHCLLRHSDDCLREGAWLLLCPARVDASPRARALVRFGDSGVRVLPAGSAVAEGDWHCMMVLG